MSSSMGLEITHIELRRVQNGFLVMGISAHTFETAMSYEGPQRASFIAKDIDELATILKSMIDGVDMRWLPTVDIPILMGMGRRIQPPEAITRAELKQAVKEAIVEA